MAIFSNYKLQFYIIVSPQQQRITVLTFTAFNKCFLYLFYVQSIKYWYTQYYVAPRFCSLLQFCLMRWWWLIVTTFTDCKFGLLYCLQVANLELFTPVNTSDLTLSYIKNIKVVYRLIFKIVLVLVSIVWNMHLYPL